jgi:hypothetical protein
LSFSVCNRFMKNVSRRFMKNINGWSEREEERGGRER